jgi:SAM-dependent methyltransferase
MTKSLDDELAALRTAIDRMPDWDGSPPAADASRPGTEPADAAPARDRERWAAIDDQLERPVTGQRVLVVGGDVAADAAAFAARDAGEILECADWETLDPERHGTFDIVHCHDLVHRVLEPISLLRRLRAMTAPGGILLLSSMMLADPERSEYLRFVPGQHAGDSACWFIPGRLAIRWMVLAAGFEIEAEFGEHEGPRDRIPVVCAYLRAVAM